VRRDEVAHLAGRHDLDIRGIGRVVHQTALWHPDCHDSSGKQAVKKGVPQRADRNPA
jgi:hypothetical protein